jgi:hypothetical protein
MVALNNLQNKCKKSKTLKFKGRNIIKIKRVKKLPEIKISEHKKSIFFH